MGWQRRQPFRQGRRGWPGDDLDCGREDCRRLRNAGSWRCHSAAGATVELVSDAASAEDLFAAFKAGKFQPAATAKPSQPFPPGSSWCDGVVQTVAVPAGATRTVDFFLAWHLPNRGAVGRKPNPKSLTDGNHCSALSSDGRARRALQVTSTRGRPAWRHSEPRRSTVWQHDPTSAQLPDSAAGRLAVTRSSTTWQSRIGVVLGTEGNGCCPLNHTHVHGHTMLLERLCPELARDICVTNFIRKCDQKQGGVMMRFGIHFALDGALACVVKACICVRQADSKLTSLQRVWPNVKQQMDFVFAEFDGGNGVITCVQQDTHDAFVLGSNTFVGSHHVTALKAVSPMAALTGDMRTAARRGSRAAVSAANHEKTCWSEKFGRHVADATPVPRRAPVPPSANGHPFRPGTPRVHRCGGMCFVDQLRAIGLSSATGLGHILERAHEASARKAILLHDTIGPQPGVKPLVAHFATGDSGILDCTNPNDQEGSQPDGHMVSGGFASRASLDHARLTFAVRPTRVGSTTVASE